MKKTFAFCAIITLLFSCKTKEVLTPNRPPNAFTITPTLKSDGKTIILNWTKAKDPDGDALTYEVVLKDTLAKNISDTTYTITNLDFNYSQAGKIIAKDAKGLKTEASFTATTKVAEFVSIPDANFEKYLVYFKIDKDGVINGRMARADTKGVEMLNPAGQYIKELTGLEAFADLKMLSCGFNPLIGLDVSKNINLTFLDCYSAQLTSLDVSKNINLTILVCFSNQLTSLDVSKNINLYGLICRTNQLKTLDLSKNKNLNSLTCSYKQIASLDMKNNLELREIFNDNSNLQNIDVSKNTKLTTLDLNRNKLSSLDVSKNIALETLSSISNLIKTICVADVIKANANKNWRKDDTATYEVCK